MDFSISEEDKINILKLARKTIEEKLFGKSSIEVNTNLPIFSEKAGAFVTLHINKSLRGCIGNIVGYRPLKETIEDMAISSAFRDPRFPPLTKEEYKSIDIEVSILSPIYELKSVDDIIVGKHGIIVSKGFNHGLLLPQVATEHNWDNKTFLSHCCMKAGLPPDEWKRGVKIEAFEAIVFGEK